MKKAQGALEYMLLVGGAVIVATVVTVFLIGTGQAGSDTASSTNYKIAEKKAISVYGWTVAGGVNNGLSGFYSFDDGTANDPARKNNGTLFGGPTLLSGTNCKRGSCFQFNGTNQYISFRGSKSEWGWNTLSGSATVAAWFKADSLPAIQATIVTDNCGVELGFSTTGTNLYLTGSSVSKNAGAISTGQWYHAAVTHEHPEGSTTNTIIKYYLNGNLIGTQTKTLSATEISTNGYADFPYLLGGDFVCYPAAPKAFSGVIDEVEFYNRALTDSEILALYKAT